ncbi:MAG: transcription-repair coupling factor [Acidimicrobiales bacterium]
MSAFDPLLARVATDPAIVAVLGSREARLGVAENAQALVLASLARTVERRPLVVATSTTTIAERLARDIEALLGPGEAALFPAWETLPFERVSPGIETMGRRLETLWHLRDPDHGPSVVVAPIRSLLQRLAPGAVDAEPVTVGVGDVVDQADLVERLVDMGYRRDVQIEHRGDVAVRGSIVDVFPSTADAPVRIDLWGDEVDRLTTFSLGDQRSVAPVSEVTIFGCREVVPSPEIRARAADLVAREPWGREQWERLSDGEMFDGMESWLPWLVDDEHGDATADIALDHVGADALVVLVDPARIRDRAEELRAEEEDLAHTLARTWDAESDDESRSFPHLHVPFTSLLATTDAPVWSVTTLSEGPDIPVVNVAGWDPPTGTERGPVRQVAGLVGDGTLVAVAADGAGSAARIGRLLADEGVELDVVDSLDRSGIVVAPLERGCVLPDVGVAVLAESELVGRRRTRRRPVPRPRAAQGPIDDLAPGAYVVHETHGIARYEGMVTRAIGGVERDYLLLQYRGDDRLYVPSDQIDVVRHYTGGDTPTLSKMGGSDWQKAKSRVRSAVHEVAQELVVLYQRRLASPGRAFEPDTPWQRELAQAFPYQETPDQLTAIEEVTADMERTVPMDRLICGDVGFGKTEVAIRGAFKAIQSGAQVAMLVPTTLLAQQHHQTLSERFAGFPVRVEVLSRFVPPADTRKVLAGLEDGSVDMVVGTHRLLSGDVKFKDLGLLIVDEEQRFGVSHKEAIKNLRANVDVLTLTATPIPRTLEMSLTGIRDLTLLQTPPADRQPILTYVGEHDERAVAEAIRRELLREGQIFFVHNRIADIEHVAARIRDLVPEARTAVAHGQMDEVALERVVLDFWEGEFDVLVCTTIIESGIDMPTVNTLVVDRADMLGLGQLHQLRGRVGRAGVRAYAYLFTPPDKVLSEEAYERLKTIGEATELGSGFKIAMRDLEIRGAGNLLGTGQSGHIAAVGYDLYCQLVTEAVAELKGEEVAEPVEIRIELPVDAHLPAAYVPSESMRLGAYRRLSQVTTADQVDDVAAEWADRYGPPPPEAEALLAVARLRAECLRTGVTDVAVLPGPGFGGPKHIAKISPLALKESKKIRLQRQWPKATYKEGPRELQLPIARKGDVVDEVINALRELVPPPEPGPEVEADTAPATAAT